MYKLKFKYYLLYLLFVVMLYCILIIFLPSVKVAEFDTSIPSARQIIVHNLKNYLMWSVSFITWPLNFLFESFVLSFNIKTGIANLGGEGTFIKLWKHGIIEFPNMCLYQFLSIRLLYFWRKDKRLSTVYDYVLSNKRIYCCSALLIFVAGMIEGMK